MRKACCCGQPFREVRASRKIPRATWRWRDVSWVLPGFAASWVEKLVSKWLMVTGSDFSRPNYWTFNCFTANPSSHPTWGGEEKDWVGGRYRATLRCTMWVSECIWWFLWYLMVADASMHALCEYPSSFGMVALCYHNTRFCNRAKVRSPWISPENKAMFRSDRA